MTKYLDHLEFEEADLCVIAIPIEGVPAVVKELADNQGKSNYNLITDVASNKRPLIEVLDELNQDSKGRSCLSLYLATR